MPRSKKLIVLDVPADSSKHERQERLKVVRTDESGNVVAEKKATPVKILPEKKVATPKVKLTAREKALSRSEFSSKGQINITPAVVSRMFADTQSGKSKAEIATEYPSSLTVVSGVLNGAAWVKDLCELCEPGFAYPEKIKQKSVDVVADAKK